MKQGRQSKVNLGVQFHNAKNRQNNSLYLEVVFKHFYKIFGLNVCGYSAIPLQTRLENGRCEALDV